MPENTLPEIERLLASTNPIDLRHGLEQIKQEIGRLGPDNAAPMFELIAPIFYIDPLDHPELLPILNEALLLVVGFGKGVIPILIQQLDAGDVKAQMAFAHALGRIGVDAIAPLIKEYEEKQDASHRDFVIYALSKIKAPQILEAVPCAVESASSPDLELRDTATRAIGKFAEVIPPSIFSEENCQDIVDVLLTNIADHNPAIRAKAVRSLGKLAKYGHLDPDQRHALRRKFKGLLGKEGFEWDRAYVVRRQAEEALPYL